MKAKIIKTVITNENNEFKIGEDIHFYLNRNNKTYDCFGVISDIDDDSFKINKVEIDKMSVSDLLTIKYSEVKDGILHHTDHNWY